METNIQEQPVNPNDLIVFQNTDNEDFEWQFDAIKTPLPYFIGAGQTRKLPYYIARHGIEKLIDKILQKANKQFTSPIFRNEERNKIVLGLEHINYIREKTANEIALEEMQRKKDIDPYKELFKAREIQAERQAQAVVDAAKPAAPLITTTGTVVQPIAPQVSNPTQPVVPTATALNNIDAPEAAADPERHRVYSLLITKLHMDLTHVPTKEKLDATPVDQLKTEFASELPELINPQAAVVADTAESLKQDGMPVTDKGAPIVPEAPPVPTPAQPVAPAAPTISMNPQAPAAPILEQQLNGTAQ